MKIVITSVMVDDQEKALKFYTEVLGFVKKTEIDMGEAKWLTVVSPEGGDVELLLEPDWNASIQLNDRPAAKEFKAVLFEAGIPYTSFGVEDIQKEFKRLKDLGVKFTMEPTQIGPV